MRLCALLVMLLVAVSIPSWAGDENDVDGRSWHGILPDPDPKLDAEHFVCRVVDDVTGQPVEGARFVRTPEWITPWRVRHDVPLGVATTDALGVAWLPTTPGRWEDDCHWLVTAEGYGFVYEYGALPPVEMRLPPEAPLRGRVVDPLGRPVAGARVESLGGCSHGTAASSVRTAPDGTFTLRGVDAQSGQLWVDGLGIAADLLAMDWPESLGTEGVVLAMETGVRYRGRVVDLLGAPLPRTVIRVYNEQRGPVTATGTDGSFVLEGAEDDGGFVVFSPADITEDESTWHVSDVLPDVPCTLVVGPLGVVEEETTGSLRVRALDEAGRPVGGLAFAVLSSATGRGPLGVTADEAREGLEVGEAQEEVGPGPWRVVPADALTSHTFDPVEVEAGATEVTLSPRAQPRLRIVGEIPEEAGLQVAVAGASTGIFDESLPWLPAEGPAGLRVTLEGRPPFFFPVGPVVEGVRTARVILPLPRHVVLPAGATDARLAHGVREAYHWVDESAGLLLTDASGTLTLSFDDDQGRRMEVDIVVPDEPGAAVVVDAATAHAVVPTPYEEDVELSGPCTLSITIRDVDGPVDAIVLVGGVPHAAPEGAVTVRGLDAEVLRVVAARRDVVGPGRVFDVKLEPGETTLSVELSWE